jgi:hypothetical protein
MLDSWHKMLPKKTKEWGLERQEVVMAVGYGFFLRGGAACACLRVLLRRG